MSETNPEGDRQDPAEQYRTDEAVETTEQEPAAEPEAEVETGGEMIAHTGIPIEVNSDES